VNTSFNVRGEPIVNTPAEAWRCFMGTDLDALAIGGYLLLKEDQPAQLKRRYESTIEKD
jgi:carbamoyltransferase